VCVYQVGSWPISRGAMTFAVRMRLPQPYEQDACEQFRSLASAASAVCVADALV